MKARHIFYKFFSVGVIATLAQYGVLVLFVELVDMMPTIASSVGYFIGAIINYWLNYHLTFKSDAKHHRAVVKFAVVASIGLLLNFCLMLLLIEYVALKYLFAQILSTLVVFLFNFFAHKKWTFN